MNVKITPEAAELIRRKGGQVVIFQGLLSGCCAGSLPAPAMEVGRPRQSPDNYSLREEAGVQVYLEKTLLEYTGTAEFSVGRNFWKNVVSFNYREE